MKKLLGFAVVVLVIVGCVKLFGGRSEAAKARKVCEQLQSLCGPEMAKDGITFTSSDVAECTTDLAADIRKDFGSAYDSFVDCTSEANSCMEVIGCASGGFAGGDKDVRDFGRGFGKMMKHR